MPSAVPRLGRSLAEVLVEALTGGRDQWSRAELPPEWPVVGALKAVVRTITKVRIGVLAPFDKQDFSGLPVKVSDEAAQITKWRNSRGQGKAPTLVLGLARGREEAGLRQAPRVITEQDVLSQWESSLQGWLVANIESEAPRPFLKELVSLAAAGDIDAVELDAYFGTVLRSTEGAISRLRGDLWRIDLLPDTLALDVGLARQRLQLNLETRRLLLSPSDTAGEAKRIERLVAAAAGSNPATKSIAVPALAYRADRNREHLKIVDLETVKEVLAPHSPPRPHTPRPLDLLELLDVSPEVHADGLSKAFAELAEGWDLEAVEDLELSTSIPLADGSVRDAKLDVSPVPSEASPWIGDGAISEQVIAILADSGGRRDWLPLPIDGDPVRGEKLIESAIAQDTLLTEPMFEALAREYLAARAELQPYERWFRQSAFELLFLNAKAREAVRVFLGAWQGLVDAANQFEDDDVDAIRAALTMLEGIWGREGSHVQWCVLGPFHPYILDPLLRVVDYAHASLGREELGTKVRWTLDRAFPAYRALWAPDDILFLANEYEIYEFERSPGPYNPPARSGAGLHQVVRSFLDFHPFASEALVITLINPPRGGGVARNLRAIAATVRDLRVYVVLTSGHASQLEELSELVRNLGRFPNTTVWLDKAPVRSHLLFYFAERQPGSATAGGQGWGPTPGAYVAPRIRVDSAFPFGSDALMPFVTFEPRENNRVVVGIQKLSKINRGSPRLFEVQPMLDEEESERFARLGEVADWTVLCAPSPLGLVPSRTSDVGAVYVGRDSLGTYGLFVFATSLFAIRKFVTEKLRPTPLVPTTTQVEDRLSSLALESASGVLRLARSQGNALWEHVGLIVSSALSRNVGN